MIVGDTQLQQALFALCVLASFPLIRVARRRTTRKETQR